MKRILIKIRMDTHAYHLGLNITRWPPSSVNNHFGVEPKSVIFESSTRRFLWSSAVKASAFMILDVANKRRTESTSSFSLYKCLPDIHVRILDHILLKSPRASRRRSLSCGWRPLACSIGYVGMQRSDRHRWLTWLKPLRCCSVFDALIKCVGIRRGEVENVTGSRWAIYASVFEYGRPVLGEIWPSLLAKATSLVACCSRLSFKLLKGLNSKNKNIKHTWLPATK